VSETDLTKLSGPELAAIIRGAWVVNEGTPPLSEAMRRLEEDERVWQRNLERERDLLRAELADTKKDLEWQRESCERLRLRGIEEDDSYDPYQRLCDILDEECGLQPAKLPVGTMLSMIENALFEWRKRFGCLDAERNELTARLENVRASLGGAEKDVSELSAELAESKRLLGTMVTSDLEGVRDSERLKHWRKWAESFPCALETNGTDGAVMNAIAVKLHDAETRAESAENRLENAQHGHWSSEIAIQDVVKERDHWKSKALGTQAQIDRDDRIAQGMSTAELVAELDRMREKRDELQGQLLQCRARCEAQRKELASLNVERKATLTKLEDAQKRVAELEEGQRSARQLEFCANGSIAGIDERGCYQVASDGVRHEADPRYVLSVAAELIYSKLEANDAALARIAELEHPETGEHVKGYRDGLQTMARQVEAATKRIAELEEQLSIAQGSMTSMQHNAERRLERVKKLEAQLRDTVSSGDSGKDSKPGPVFALSPSEQSVVDFVRGSFGEHDPQHTRVDVLQLLAIVDRATSHSKPAPAERKPHDARELAEWLEQLAKPYDRLSSLPGRPSADGDRLRSAAHHLRELLDERKAIEALADEMEAYPVPHWAAKLREVLNGKR
jgi:uncharacterized coiled-coil DUF342 family protein